MPKTTQFKPRQSGSWVCALNHFTTLLHPWDVLISSKCISEPTVLSGFLRARNHLCQVPCQDWMHILCLFHKRQPQDRRSKPVVRWALCCDQPSKSPSRVYCVTANDWHPWSCFPTAHSGIRNRAPTNSRARELQGPRVWWWMAQLGELLQMAQPDGEWLRDTLNSLK